MADRELRKLKRRELLQMLLVQCEETERLQRETDEVKKEFDKMMESYVRLKKKLDLKDARLNQKDAKIAELQETIEEMRSSKAIELEEAGSIAEAALKINGVFEAAQRAAEQYLMNIRQLSEKASAKAPAKMRAAENQIPFESGRISGTRKKARPVRTRQVVPMSVNQTTNYHGALSGENETGHVRMAAASGDIHG